MFLKFVTDNKNIFLGLFSYILCKNTFIFLENGLLAIKNRETWESKTIKLLVLLFKPAPRVSKDFQTNVTWQK